MLREISCDKFISNGEVRPPIVFHRGLNAVVGNESGTNSVGKSTFLMILDFVFGGVDYISRSGEVFKEENVGVHTFKFAFEFDGKTYYFTRKADPEDYKTVIQCNEKYEPLKNGEMTLSKYWEFLAQHYGLTENGQTWRGSVARFIRVDRRDTMDTIKPLKAAANDTERDGIVSFIRLYGKYNLIENNLKRQDSAEAEETAFKEAQRYNYIPALKNATEFKKNEERIKTLEAEIESLADKNSNGLLELTSMQAEQLSEIKNKIAAFRRQRTVIQTQLEELQQNQENIKKKLRKDYNELVRFFPEMNVAKLEEVERFHAKLALILKDEIKESKKKQQSLLAMYDDQIKELEEQQIQISQIPNVTKATLSRFAELEKELQALIAANEAYSKKEELHKKTVSLKEALDKLIVNEMRYIETKLNALMDTMNESLYLMKIKPPRFLTLSANSYKFETEDDKGTGTRYKGMILLDLAVLQTSKLPFIIHDSVLLLNIEIEVIEKILELYAKQTDKQVFIAYDKTATKRGYEILEDTMVLHLTRGGNELFGKTWNRQEDKKDPQQTTIDNLPDAGAADLSQNEEKPEEM